MAEKPAAIPGAFTLHDFPLGGSGSPDVLINGLGAWRTGDRHLCRIHGPEDVRIGVDHVLINGESATRMGDFLQGAGPSNRIMSGSPNVFIGAPTLTGTGSKENIDWFCKRWCKLKADWKEMTPEERRKAYKELLQQQFMRLGMPPPRLTEDAPSSSDGAFNPGSWTVMVPEGAFDGEAPPERLAEATLHETRHAEQFHAAARERAGRHQGGTSSGGPGSGAGNDPITQEELAEISDCPAHVDQSAYKNPLDPTSREGKWARLWADEQISEAGKKQFNEITKEYGAAAQMQDQDPDRFDKAVEAYKNRPGGADADEVGKLAETCKCP